LDGKNLDAILRLNVPIQKRRKDYEESVGSRIECRFGTQLDPDPIACNVFLDCHWVAPVCIGGNTYMVGFFVDPASLTPEGIEAAALFWTGTVLSAGACPFVGYSIPWVLLYKSAELTNGYGIIVSTENFASSENILKNFQLAAIPADLVQVCSGPVTQMYPEDTQGKWVCDPLLAVILPYDRAGGRYPLISDTGMSLQMRYENILNTSQ
jgi:hypothetical protein